MYYFYYNLKKKHFLLDFQDLLLYIYTRNFKNIKQLKRKVMKNTLEILKTRQEEVIEETMNILGSAIAGNTGMFVSNLAFCIFNKEDGSLTVDYYPYVGNQIHSDSVFWTLESKDMPTPRDLGVESMSDVEQLNASNFADLGYGEYILQEINYRIENIETLENW